jgi:DNA polymerase family B
MNSKVSECISGLYQYDAQPIVYSDTDSSYFTAYDTLKSEPETAWIADDKDQILALYHQIGDIVNESFPIFMNEAFNTGLDRGSIIAAGLELVANNGLFIKKKRYAVLKYWDESSGRLDVNGKPGKIKAMGLDLKRADTPKVMQDFLSEILLDILLGAKREEVMDKIKKFRMEFRKLDPWARGTPKKVNGLTAYADRFNKAEEAKSGDVLGRKMGKVKKDTIPGHVRASINWNNMKKKNNDKHSNDIIDGGKVIVCKLLDNPMGITSIAYPYDQTHLPKWFKQLPFDTELMEQTIIDKKVMNLIGILGWDIRESREDTAFNDLFTF